MSTHRRVSFDDEPLILVDADDQIIGYQHKAQAHAGEGTLHRAFSIFLFNPQGQVLLQQRSDSKPLWPLFWSNSCCSHPRRGESYADATHRRLNDELAVDTELEFIYQFEYHAKYQADARDIGSERELCSVYIGRIDDSQRIDVNPSEIAACRWLSGPDTDALLKEQPDQITPWFAMEWRRLREEFPDRLERLLR
ncbi:isopentenyl-diphosphate Delta-isomerase [Rhabdochromatium marinum]|uniref:isopentenyl-diphosphate Delta-isomerase n=1 Tax=Rhabdochromatium marinum TaxID=48729 RepID=UPI001905A092|nr:isopentenyl-diphosphate Delta-isomerase [Rhabdochromatium marinum]MBK1649776.1 isopentenyl-diphosphate delta-isomerase [Rhabdochromatium marinum]